MHELLTGLRLAIEHAPPVLVFGLLYRTAWWLDLSLDAQLAASGVVFASLLLATASFTASAAVGIAVAVVIAALIFAITEWGRVPVDITSLLLTFILFKALELFVGESISIVAAHGRLHVEARRHLGSSGLAEGLFSLALLVAFALTLEAVVRSHRGLMYRALGENPSLSLREPRWKVRGAITIMAGALIGLAGVIEVDRQGGVFSGFHLSRVVDAFIVAELTRSLASRAEARAASMALPRGRLLWWIARTSVVLQLLVGSLALNTVSYMLIRYMHPAVPSLIEAALVIVLLARVRLPKRVKDGDPRGRARARPGLVVEGLSKTFRAGAREVHVLCDVTLRDLPESGLILLVGDNGAGKSTFLRVLAGVVEADAGRATIDGAPSPRKCRYLSQDPLESIAPSLTVRENLDLALARSRAPLPFRRVGDEEAMASLHRFSRSEALIRGIDRPASAFSGGEIQLLALVCAAVDTKARVLLADEPEKMLDTVHRDLVQRELVRLAETRLVLVSSHTPRFDLTPPERHYEVRDGSVRPLRADPA